MPVKRPTATEGAVADRATAGRRMGRIAGVVAVAMAVVGVMHAPLARAWLQGLCGCPMARARMTADRMDRARHLAGASASASPRARARPALGFALEGTTEKDVEGWARANGVHCE